MKVWRRRSGLPLAALRPLPEIAVARERTVTVRGEGAGEAA